MEPQIFKSEFRSSVIGRLSKARWSDGRGVDLNGYHPTLSLVDADGTAVLVEVEAGKRLHFASVAVMSRVADNAPQPCHVVLVTTEIQEDSMRAIAKDCGVELIEVAVADVHVAAGIAVVDVDAETERVADLPESQQPRVRLRGVGEPIGVAVGEANILRREAELLDQDLPKHRLVALAGGRGSHHRDDAAIEPPPLQQDRVGKDREDKDRQDDADQAEVRGLIKGQEHANSCKHAQRKGCRDECREQRPGCYSNLSTRAPITAIAVQARKTWSTGKGMPKAYGELTLTPPARSSCRCSCPHAT